MQPMVELGPNQPGLGDGGASWSDPRINCT